MGLCTNASQKGTAAVSCGCSFCAVTAACWLGSGELHRHVHGRSSNIISWVIGACKVECNAASWSMSMVATSCSGATVVCAAVQASIGPLAACVCLHVLRICWSCVVWCLLIHAALFCATGGVVCCPLTADVRQGATCSMVLRLQVCHRSVA